MTALDAYRRRLLVRATRLCGAAAAAVAAIALIGWIARAPLLQNVFVGANPVQCLLSAAMILTGFALLRCAPEARTGCRPLAAVAFGISLYTLGEYVAGRALSIDRFLPPDPTLVDPRLPGHMTLLSAVVLALVSSSVLCLDVSWKSRRPSNGLAGLAWGLSLLGLVNHLYGVNLLTGGLDMAIASSVIFLLLSSGTLMARPGLVAQLLLDPGAGGIVARRFFPAALLVPLAAGWGRTKVAALFDTPQTATAATAVLISAAFCVLVIVLARRFEEAAIELESVRLHFQAAVANVKDYAIILLDAHGRVATWNAGARALHGFEADEIIGRRLAVFYPPERAEERSAQELSVAARDGRFEEESWRLRKDGSRFWASVVLTAVRDERGELTGFLKVTRDMTARRRAEDELAKSVSALERSNADLQNFAYVASHDLQEPLRKVTSFAQLFAQRYRGQVDETATRYIDYIVDGAARMQRLITDLLAYSRLGAAGEAEETDLNSAVRSAWSELSARAQETGARLDLGELPLVKADPRRMVQFFENLLANAIKFRKKDEPLVVRVWAEKEGSRRVISVADNGIGIEEAYHEQIFAMFRRLHSQSEYPGTGIGLAICKRVVEQLGGRIWVESEPGRGSTFRFTIPEAALI